MSAPANLKISAQTPTTVGYYRVQPGQSVYDICLQVYGTLDYLVRLMVDNNINGTNANDLTGSLIKFDKRLMKRPASFIDNANKNVVYATNVYQNSTSPDLLLNIELREAGDYELREDGSYELRQ